LLTLTSSKAIYINRFGSYFKKPSYDVAIADFAEYGKQPFAASEFLTFLNFVTDAGSHWPRLASIILSFTISARFA
jgi:hypothetical protein